MANWNNDLSYGQQREADLVACAPDRLRQTDGRHGDIEIISGPQTGERMELKAETRTTSQTLSICVELGSVETGNIGGSLRAIVEGCRFYGHLFSDGLLFVYTPQAVQVAVVRHKPEYRVTTSGVAYVLIPRNELKPEGVYRLTDGKLCLTDVMSADNR